MKVSELIEAMNLEILNLPSGAGARDITGGYTGDLLSWVMGCVNEGEVWVTIMTNINVIAVALLRDVSAVLLAENAELEQAVIDKAVAEGVTLLRAPEPAFALCAKIGALLDSEKS